MPGLSVEGQSPGRARRTWPPEVNHETLRPPSRPAASIGLLGRPQPL